MDVFLQKANPQSKLTVHSSIVNPFCNISTLYFGIVHVSDGLGTDSTMSCTAQG